MKEYFRKFSDFGHPQASGPWMTFTECWADVMLTSVAPIMPSLAGRFDSVWTFKKVFQV